MSAVLVRPETSIIQASTPTLARNCQLELRKMADTGPARMLLVAGVVLSFLAAATRIITAKGGNATLGSIGDLAAMPLSVIVTVVAVLGVTNEFVRGEAQLTFTAEPRRGIVLAIKAISTLFAALCAAVVTYVVAVAVAAVFTLVNSDSVTWSAKPSGIASVVGSVVFSAAVGWALAIGVRNAPTVIAVILVWPTVATVVTNLSSTLHTVLGYVDIDPVFSLTDGTDHAVLKVITSTLFWVVLPAALGTRYTLKADLS